MPREKMNDEAKKAFADKMAKWREDNKDKPKKPRQKRIKKSVDGDKFEKKGEHIVMHS